MKRKVLAIVGVTVVATETLWQLYKFIRSRCIEWYLSKPFARVMFFTRESPACHSHLFSKGPCGRPNCPVKHMWRIINYIRNAESTVHVCLYFLTCQPLCFALIEAHRRGISVKIVLDSHLTDSSLARAHELYKAGIPVMICKIDELMHHKFAIIDSRILITGSLNWTGTGFFGNMENVLVTNYRPIVEPYNVEFERIWVEFAISSCTEDILSRCVKNNVNDSDEKCGMDYYNKVVINAAPPVPPTPCHSM